MLLLNLPQSSLLQFLVHINGIAPGSNINTQIVMALACVGGALHGVAMALRKWGGKGHVQYYLEWRWWVGVLSDAVAGCLLWPAMPIVSVEVLVPMVVVCQLTTSYLLGMIFFKEESALNHNLGLAFAVLGVIGISMSTAHRAAAFPLDEFFAAWVSTRFMAAIMLTLGLLGGAYNFASRSTFWALLSAVLEGLQYICSRTIVESMFDFKLTFFKHPAVMAAATIKISCILGILHFQQQGLDEDLSRFAGIFLVSCTLFTCIFGTAFFGEEVPSSLVFTTSAFFTLGGIWLLNYRQEAQVSDGMLSDQAGKDVEAIGGNDDASIYEGESTEVGG